MYDYGQIIVLYPLPDAEVSRKESEAHAAFKTKPKGRKGEGSSGEDNGRREDPAFGIYTSRCRLITCCS